MVSSPNVYTEKINGPDRPHFKPKGRVDVIIGPIDEALAANEVAMAEIEAPDLVLDALDNWVRSGVIPVEWVQDPLWAYPNGAPKQERLPLQPGQIGAVPVKFTCGCDGLGE